MPRLKVKAPFLYSAATSRDLPRNATNSVEHPESFSRCPGESHSLGVSAAQGSPGRADQGVRVGETGGLRTNYGIKRYHVLPRIFGWVRVGLSVVKKPSIDLVVGCVVSRQSAVREHVRFFIFQAACVVSVRQDFKMPTVKLNPY